MEKSVAIAGSETMKAMLEGGFSESENNVVRFPEIQGPILEKVVEYLYYKDKYRKSTGQIPEFVIEPEIALELLVASNYLNC
jgi:transcription elongation factor B subunit 1